MCTLGFWKDDKLNKTIILEKQEHVVDYTKISYLDAILKGTFSLKCNWNLFEVIMLGKEKGHQ